MATQEEFEALKAGFRVLEEAVRNAAFTVSGGFVYSGALVDVVDEVDPMLPPERSALERALAVL